MGRQLPDSRSRPGAERRKIEGTERTNFTEAIDAVVSFNLHDGAVEDGDGLGRKIEEVPDRQRIDLSLTWRDNSDIWSVRAFIDNVTDEGRTRAIGNGGAGSNWNQIGSPLYPRFFGNLRFLTPTTPKRGTIVSSESVYGRPKRTFRQC